MPGLPQLEATPSALPSHFPTHPGLPNITTPLLSTSIGGDNALPSLYDHSYGDAIRRWKSTGSQNFPLPTTAVSLPIDED